MSDKQAKTDMRKASALRVIEEWNILSDEIQGIKKNCQHSKPR
jgi:hypothetical protein